MLRLIGQNRCYTYWLIFRFGALNKNFPIMAKQHNTTPNLTNTSSFLSNSSSPLSISLIANPKKISILAPKLYSYYHFSP